MLLDRKQLKNTDLILNQPILDYFRCPDADVQFTIGTGPSSQPGFFRFGNDIICYGRTTQGFTKSRADVDLYDATQDIDLGGSHIQLPFNPQDVVKNLLHERYVTSLRGNNQLSKAAIRRIYYLLRPYLGLPLRMHLQRFHLRNWDKIPFPAWPVDFSIDRLQRRLLALMMRAAGLETIPFIWFWPDGFTACSIVTHDVEHTPGKQFCDRLMDIDDSYGFKSSFQIVPQGRYSVEEDFLQSIRDRGFEINVHDFNHDGHLYDEHEEFLRRAQEINRYAREYGAEGFRSGILYRNADWYDAFEFSYDMSLPNVGHLDPQHGGCCTVMPFFVGDLVVLPLTCTQDHTLFNILDDYSLSLWKQQIGLIKANHGLITILSHPDYLLTPRAQNTYKELLHYLNVLREDGSIWTPLPREVATWWRQRNRLHLVQTHGRWEIQGEGKERARLAYAHLVDGKLEYTLDPPREAANS
jgi:hypothetical protein